VAQTTQSDEDSDCYRYGKEMNMFGMPAVDRRTSWERSSFFTQTKRDTVLSELNNEESQIQMFYRVRERMAVSEHRTGKPQYPPTGSNQPKSWPRHNPDPDTILTLTQSLPRLDPDSDTALTQTHSW